MYELNEIILKNDKYEKKRLVIKFHKESYAILAEFLMSDAHLLKSELELAENEIFVDFKDKIKLSGNRCSVEIDKEVTVITDLFMDIDEGGYEELKLATNEFFNYVNMWTEKTSKFNKENEQ